jgi:hypothetical protein
MAGDFSRRTFNVEKRYAAVQAQQGRVLTDADVNEQVDIGQHRTQTEAVDTIGLCGVPKGTNGFKIDKTPTGDDLTISSGRIYVEGLLCELGASPVLLSFPAGSTAPQASVGALIVDDRGFEVGQRVEIFADDKPDKILIRITAIDASSKLLTFDTDISAYRPTKGPAIRRATTYITQPDDPAPAFINPFGSPPGFEALSLGDGTFVAYLNVWQREVTALDDLHIREVALGGPDTGTRLKNVWQLQLLKVTPPGDGKPDCSTSFPEWDQLTSPGTGLMNARAVSKDDTSKPCVLPPKSGFRRLENQLYRVEIHREGDRDHATFKVSRENASVRTGIKVSGSTIVLDKEPELGFKGGDWVEIVDETSTLKGSPYALIQISVPSPPSSATREITTSASIGSFSGKHGLSLVRWDQSGATATQDGVAMSAGWIELEDGVQVSFSEGIYRSGDFWLIPARTGTGDVEWPPFEVPNINPIQQPPLGIKRHYCALALLTVKGGAIEIKDCRELFPSLTDIAASDVSYDPAKCSSLAGAKTVQQALDRLCNNGRGTCTVVAIPGEDLQLLFDGIKSKDAEICFQIGPYPIPKTVVIKGKGRLKINGSGPGTQLIAENSEAALRFEQCESVSVRDLSAEGRVTGSNSELNGALTFVDCAEVDVERVNLACAGGAKRAATCVTVRNNTPDLKSTQRASPYARIAQCKLEVGHLQTGILFVNVARCDAVDNRLSVVPKPPGLQIPSLVTNREFRAALRARLVGFAAPGSKLNAPRNARIRSGSVFVVFRTLTSLVPEWQEIITANPPASTGPPPQLLRHLKRLADRVLIDPTFRATNLILSSWFDALVKFDEAVALQGIVVGGRIARDIRVVDNTIEGFLQGVHIGVSHQPKPGEPIATRTDVVGTISIIRNTIEIVVSQDAIKRERQGIFVGNCDSLDIENNVIRLRPLNGANDIEIDGVEIRGLLGKKILVRHNHLFGFSTGVTIKPRVPKPPKPPIPTAAGSVLWLVADNLFEGTAPTRQVSPTFAAVGNKPVSG